MKHAKVNRNFMGIRTSGLKAFIDQKILEGERPYILVPILRSKGYNVSQSYLYEYANYFLAQRKAKADSILEDLEAQGLIPYINETSLLKAIVAHAAKKVTDATLRDGLDAAKALLSAKLHLSEPMANKVAEMMGKWFKPVDAEGEVVEVNGIEKEKEDGTDKV